MLDGLSLPRRAPFSYGPTHENNKFLNAEPLKKSETAKIGVVRQYNGVRTLWDAFEHQQRRDLLHSKHLFYIRFFLFPIFIFLLFSLSLF